MKANEMMTELELIMSRNFAVLEQGARQLTPAGRAVYTEQDVRDMLKAIAANVAQVYAPRVHREDCTALEGGSCACPSIDEYERFVSKFLAMVTR
jgi:hypothetical protein